MLGHTRGETSDVEMGSSLLLSRFRMSAWIKSGSRDKELRDRDRSPKIWVGWLITSQSANDNPFMNMIDDEDGKGNFDSPRCYPLQQQPYSDQPQPEAVVVEEETSSRTTRLLLPGYRRVQGIAIVRVVEASTWLLYCSWV